MFNKFKKKEKFSLYGIVSNTGTAGLNWTDQSNFGGSNGIMNADENGNIIGTDDISPWDGNYNGQGYPLVQTGGVHYNNKWDNDKHSINGNYKIMQLYVNGNNATNSEFILPDSTTSYYQNQQQSFKNQVLRNKLDGSYEWTIDTTSSLKLDFGGTLIHKSTYGTNATQSLNVLDSSRVNNAFGRTSTESDNNGLTSQLFWRKKLKKKGRTISLNVRENYGYNNSTGYLYSQNNYFTADTLSLSQLTDQYKTGTAKDLNIKANATYTESLSRSVSMVLNYGVIIDNRSADKLSFNKSAGGKYDSLNGLYSSNYVFNTFTQKGGFFLNVRKKKYYFDLGSNIGYFDFKQHDLIADTVGKRSFVNWYPSAFFRYSIATQNSIDISYNGNTSQPSLQQIQPFRNNDDPLNIAIGNAALKPSFQNNIRMSYYIFKALTNQNLWASLNYSFTENAISTNSYVDSIGRRVTQSINVNGNYSITGNINYGFKWKKPDLNFNLNGNINKYQNESIVNNEQNITNSDNYTVGFYTGKYKEKKYDLSLQASATYTTSSSSIQTTFATKYWSYIIQPNFDFFLPLKLQIHSDLNYTIRQKVAAFNNNANVALWNAWFGKKLLKSDNLLVKISVNDILNQNKGISRNVNSNFISQNTYSTIQRYALLSLVWNFNKAGTPAPQGGGMIMISN